jgi:branched-chain amino acid transport system substrate-binding protein
MNISTARRLVTFFAFLVFDLGGSAHAEDRIVKLGVLTDLSSPQADNSGPDSVIAVNMAIEDSGLRAKGWKIDVVSADHRLMPNIEGDIARRWVDNDNVDTIVETSNSAGSLMVNNIAREKNVIFLNSGSAIPELTGKLCSPNTISYTYDTYMLAHGAGKVLTQMGDVSWFFLTTDYAFGHALERDTTAAVTDNGGRVLDSARSPLNTQDFSSFLQNAKVSKAKVIALATSRGDAMNAIKQASRFDFAASGQTLVAPFLFASDIHKVGLKTAQGLILVKSFYWDLNDQTRAWSSRFIKLTPSGAMPSMVVAGSYGVVLHYLKALEALGGNPHDGAKVVAKMKELPTDDPVFGKGTLRADGRHIIPAYLFRVKKPGESKYPWDYYKLVATISPDDAAKPLGESGCPLATMLLSGQPAAQEQQPVASRPPSKPEEAAPLPSSHQDLGRRLALVIGNSSYTNDGPLPNPRRDADAVAASLRADGFQTVTVKEDMTRAQMIAALNDFSDQAANADWALIYFSGHGLELGGINYVVPVDAKLLADRDVQDEAVSLDRLLSATMGAKKLHIVILDACRDDPFVPKMRQTAATRSIGRGLARVEPEGATVVVYAARDGQIAYDGDGQNSPFVTALTKRLAEPNLEINKLFRLVHDDVLAATGRRQEPYVYGALPGEDFYFVQK